MDRKTGIIRTRFQLETVEQFRRDLEALGSNLLVTHDKPENFLKNLIEPDVMYTIAYQAEICYEERQVEKALQEQLKSLGTNYQFVPIWNSTLHHIDDLPYDPVEFFPPTNGNMRSKQKNLEVRPLHKSPKKGDLPFLKTQNEAVKEALNFMPDLRKDFNFSEEEVTAT